MLKDEESSPHKISSSDVDKNIPIISMDYCYLGAKDQHDVPPVLVLKCDTSKSIFCHQVSQKGPAEQWVVDRIVKDLNILGWGEIILKCDQEVAIVALQNAVIALRQSIKNSHVRTYARCQKTPPHMNISLTAVQSEEYKRSRAWYALSSRIWRLSSVSCLTMTTQ